MTVVLDASAAIEVFLNKPDAERFKTIISQADLILTPDTFPSEITNVFWKYASYSDFDLKKCESGIKYCLELIDDFIDTKEICHEVFSESLKNKHSSYDIFYLIVARRNNSTILSKDKKLIQVAKSLGISC